MKVRIEFDDAEPGEDLESYFYTAVEFWQKCNTKEQWADATMLFMRPAVYGPAVVLASILNDDESGLDLDLLVYRLRPDVREELQKLLSVANAQEVA